MWVRYATSIRCLAALISNPHASNSPFTYTVHKNRYALITYPKLLMAAVNGRGAIGIAVTLLLHCDIVYCSQRSKFWIPFTRLALVPEFASGHLLPKICGKARTNRLLLLGEEITAREAAGEFGIVTRVVDSSSSKDVVQTLVDDVER